MASRALLVLCLIAMGSGIGCATPDRQTAVPNDRTVEAEVTAAPGSRYYLREDLDRWIDDAVQTGQWRVADAEMRGVDPDEDPGYFLALSGGGENGAFGAGLLCGWTATGTRPEFQVVTGISTGALIAPFAFLGPDYDHVLRHVYTKVGPDDIFDKRRIWAAIWDDAMADTGPLEELIETYVTTELLEKIAAQYRRGRWLMVATTNLDARRPTIWNMGLIATQGTPEALELFRQVTLASASIPGAFPPVMIDVELDGQPHQEMHVDGGAMAQAFLFPPSFSTAAMERGMVQDRERHVYVIRNARLDPEWAAVDRRTLSIMGRALSSLIQSQGFGDLYRIYSVSQRHGMEFNLAFIPETFDVERTESFDTKYMGELFDLGYELALDGYPWQKVPPGFDPVAK